jgi:hypothetical protein
LFKGYLFENLRRAVDDLYSTCEADESIPAAKEVILVLSNYVRWELLHATFLELRSTVFPFAEI